MKRYQHIVVDSSRIVKLTLFGVVELTPFWEKQNIQEEHIEIYLLLGIFGATISFWTLIMSFGSFFSYQFLIALGKVSSPLLLLFSSIIFNLFLSIVVGLISVYIIQKQHILFKNLNIEDSWIQFSQLTKEALIYKYEEVDNISDVEKKNKAINRFYLILLTIIGIGFLTGIWWSVLLFIPWYISYILLFFILANIIQVSPFLFLLSIVITWILMYQVMVYRKLRLKDEDVAPTIPREYDVGEREIDILAANKPPIICPACRSFVSATSTRCPVCDELIEVN